MWPTAIKAEVLVACARRCAICHRFCGTKIECHHIVPESDGGLSTVENCIPLCFDCHADVGNYNPRHPKGTKYSPEELRGHRDQWFRAMALLTERQHQPAQTMEFYEGQVIGVSGFVWRETFPGPPNYQSFDTDERETYWMLVLPHPITLIAINPEHGGSYRVDNIRRLQMCLTEEHYNSNQHFVLCDARVHGRLFPTMTGHHHGDANIEVESISPAA